MDNISHAVVSLVAGELLHRSLPEEATPEKQTLRQRLLLFTAAAAGNFPDLDLVLYPLLKRPLGYLLHHRGHSHTLAGVCLEAVLLFVIVYALWPSARRLLKTEARARRAFFGAAAIGFALHLSMDWLNSYGVHPFWPFDTHWYYGDLVFIVEPVFWIAFGVPVAFLTRRWWLRFPVLLVVLGVPAWACFARGFVPFLSIAVLLLIAVVLSWLQSREPERGRRALVSACAIGFLFIVGQAVAMTNARQDIARELRVLDPSAHLYDTALTALPSSPLCWTFTSIESSGTQYRLRSGVITIAPTWKRPESCPRVFGSAGAPEKMKMLGESILQTSEEAASVDQLRTLDRSNCHLQAWMRFARMPYVTEVEAQDVRFSRTPRGNFSTLRFEDFKDEPCSSWIPQWEPPREDLLRGF